MPSKTATCAPAPIAVTCTVASFQGTNSPFSQREAGTAPLGKSGNAEAVIVAPSSHEVSSDILQRAKQHPCAAWRSGMWNVVSRLAWGSGAVKRTLPQLTRRIAAGRYAVSLPD